MLILCDQCNRQVDAKVDKDADKVVCPECRAEVTNITKFAFEHMKRNREYLVENKKSFSFPCKKCNIRTGGVVKRDGSAVVCTVCGSPQEVAPFMVLTMKNLGLYEGKTTE